MDISAKSLHTKRKVISKFLDAGLYPYTKAYLGSFNNHFSTIGILGMNEACLNASWLGSDLTHPESLAFAEECLKFMRKRLSDYQELYTGELFNLEATPAESTSYRLAKHDKVAFPDIITAQDTADGVPYYTNSSHLPVGFTDDIFTALDSQDKLQPLYTSGTVFHSFLGQNISDWRVCAKFVKTIAENYKLPYYTISPTYSVCADHGYISGEVYNCPTCGKLTEVYSRITGYYRPIANWNKGKDAEFKSRKNYGVKYRDKESGAFLVPEEENNVKLRVGQDLLLFTTKTCPNCVTTKNLLDKAHIEYTVIDAEDNVDKTKNFNVKKAPTLFVPNGKEYSRLDNVSSIKRYIEGL